MHDQPGKWCGPLLLQEGAASGPCSQSAQAAMTNALTATVLKSKIEVPVDLVPPGRLSSWLAGSCLLTVSPPCQGES